MNSIQVNGRWVMVSGKALTYDEVVGRANTSNAGEHTVTFRVPASPLTGTLIQGKQLTVIPGMIITVAETA